MMKPFSIIVALWALVSFAWLPLQGVPLQGGQYQQPVDSTATVEVPTPTSAPPVVATSVPTSQPVVEPTEVVPTYSQSGSVTASDLIQAINAGRTSRGLRALIVDSILMGTAQYTAQVMAQNSMSWHIGNVSGRVQSAGYAGGIKSWATENFMVGPVSLNDIMSAWADSDHMIPMVNPAYCHIGAGVAEYNGRVYYIVQAAYPSTGACGPYQSGTANLPTGPYATIDPTQAMAQVMSSVQIATPGPDGKIYHVVKSGQTLWSISVAYKVQIGDLVKWNGISQTAPLRIDQKLLVPVAGSNLATPTPSPVAVSTAGADGKIFHVVKPNQTLWVISQLYKVKLDDLTSWNNITQDTPLRIGMKLFIPVTVTPTQPVTVTPTAPAASLTPTQTQTPTATIDLTALAATPSPTPEGQSASTAGETWVMIGVGVVIALGLGLVVLGLIFKK
jgi:uncharacterized protein YkwD/LysM repeat protein